MCPKKYLKILFLLVIFTNAGQSYSCGLFSSSQEKTARRDSVIFEWTTDGTFDFEAYGRFALDLAYKAIQRSRISHPHLEDKIIGAVQLAVSRLKSGHLNRSREGDNMNAYMQRIIQNEFRRFWRDSKNNLPQSIDVLAEHDQAPSRTDHPEVAALARIVDFRSAIAEGIEEVVVLSPVADRNRKILRLYYFDELGQKAISEMLGLPETTVKLVIHRAKHKLVDILREKGIDPTYFHEGEIDSPALELR